MNFDFITERIAVGQKIDTQGFAIALRDAGITHVINLFSPEQFWMGETLCLAQEDDGTPRPAEHIHAAIKFAFKVLAKGGKLYIHCQWGIGRAPATCYAILRAFGIGEEEAIQLLETRRPRCAAWTWKQYITSIEVALGSLPLA